MMMVVPRSYAKAVQRSKSMEFSEKRAYGSTRSASPQRRTNSPAKSPITSIFFRSRESSPATSPSRSKTPTKSAPVIAVKEVQDVPSRPGPTPQQPKEQPRYRRESAKDILSSTAIPIRRKPRGRPSQRLPKGDHVSNFSHLLMDDVKPHHGLDGLSRSVSNSNIDSLFGNMDELLEEGQMYIGSEGVDSGILSTRSLSDGSIISLPSPGNCTSDDNLSQHSDNSASVPERRLRHIATSEDCTDDHPLSSSNDEATVEPDDLSPPPPVSKIHSPERGRKHRGFVKSSLTASLKALKSAAHSVSNRSSSDPTLAQARSIFHFQPGLTDDRRPPPNLSEPNAELRRYLNPGSRDSAAQLHFWQDHRHSKFDGRRSPSPEDRRRRSPSGKRARNPVRSPSPPGVNPIVHNLPSVVQLASCLPPSVRTENASSPPIWLTSDGTPVNKNTSIPLLFDPDANDGKGEAVGRHREPRENRDFLRVFVCEMQMRRQGKLSEDLSSGRARLWLPPVDTAGNSNGSPRKESDEIVVQSNGRVRQKKTARDRMMCLTIEDI